MDIPLEQYRVFYHAAKTLNFSEAAKQLFVSQSAVSQSISKLEKKLGCQLFIRSSKKVYLTSDGVMLFEYLEQAFNSIRCAEKSIEIRKNPYEGELRIASTDTLCKYYLLPKIKSLICKYPKMKFNIMNRTSFACLELLEKASVDLAIVNLSSIINRNYVVEKSYDFTDVFVVNQDMKSQWPQEITFEDLASHTLLMLDEKTVSRQFYDDLFMEKGIIPDIEVQSVDLLIEMAKAGLGLAFIPDFCAYANEDLFILNLKGLPTRRYGLITLKQTLLTPMGKVFLDAF